MGKRTRKVANAPDKQETASKEGWWNNAEPLDEYLPKFAGFNYYLIKDDGVMRKSIIKGDEVISVEFDAEFDQLTNMDGKELKDSPSEPLEGTLSIPISVARRVRAIMEEKGWTVSDIIGKVMRLQKTGEGMKTRYPTVSLILSKDYYEE